MEVNFLDYLLKQKDITLKKYLKFNNDYNSNKIFLTNLSNKLSSIENSIFEYEKFIKKNKKNYDSKNDILNFSKIILCLNFSYFDNKKVDIKSNNNLNSLYKNLEIIPNNIEELDESLNYIKKCINKLLYDNTIEKNFDELKNIFKNVNEKNSFNNKNPNINTNNSKIKININNNKPVNSINSNKENYFNNFSNVFKEIKNKDDIKTNYNNQNFRKNNKNYEYVIKK